jgi:hypothetical protein
MHIDVTIDTSEVEEAYSLLISQIDDLKTAIVYGLRDELGRNWAQIAKNELKSTRNEYLMSLEPQDEGPLAASVVLTGQLPNMIENGATAFDMQEGFKNSGKVKFTKSGAWYLTIPFRHATPGALAENEAFTSVMSDELYRLVRKMRVVNEANLPDEYQHTDVRPEITDNSGNVVYEAYKHKGPKMAGLTQYKKWYQSATQSQYMTFRRVSENSDDLAWKHPGMSAKHFGDRALKEMDIESTMARIKDDFLESVLGRDNYQ